MYLIPDVPHITHDDRDYYQIDGASLYYVSTSGAFLSAAKKNPTLLHTHDNGIGYLQVWLSKQDNNKKPQWIKAARAVAQRFIPNPEGKPDVNHIDGDKSNNDVNNLEWCTKSENTRHAYTTGLMKAKSGPEHHRHGQPHSEETIAKLSAAKLGESHPKFAGWYVTPAGTFPSAQAAANELGTYAKKVDRYCKSGKHIGEGYDFIPATSQPQALAQAA